MKTLYKNLQLNSTYLNNKNWNSCDMKNMNNHRITVVNKDTKKRTSFEYWESIKEKEIKTERQLIFALYCFLSDASYIYDGYEWFCSNLGYDKYDKESKRLYHACWKSAEKLERIGLTQNDIYNMLNDLQENHGC